MKRISLVQFLLLFALNSIYSQEGTIGDTPSPNECGDQSSLFADVFSGESDTRILGFNRVYSTPEFETTLSESPSALLDDMKQDGFTLEYEKTRDSWINESISYSSYQQNYQGLKIVGGGLTVIHSRATTIGPDGPERPCDKQLHYFIPEIIDDISPKKKGDYELNKSDISILLEVPENSIKSVSQQYRNLADGSCIYRLVSDVVYTPTIGLTKIARIDMLTEEVLMNDEYRLNNMAPTETFGNVNLDDTDENGTSQLISSNGVITYDYTGIVPTDAEFDENLIPESPAARSWNAQDADPAVYQAHHFTTLVVEAFETIGIDFETVHVAGNIDAISAAAWGTSTVDESWIQFGSLANGTTLALQDVV